MIHAEVHSDDRVFEVAFDAESWFRQATFKEIQALVGCEFGNDYPADEVAIYSKDRNKDVKALFDYLDSIKGLPSKKDVQGFEVTIDEEDALNWLRENKQGVFRKLALPRVAKQLSKAELAELVQRIVDLLYLDEVQDHKIFKNAEYYNPDKTWDTDFLDMIAHQLDAHNLVPKHEISP